LYFKVLGGEEHMSELHELQTQVRDVERLQRRARTLRDPVWFELVVAGAAGTIGLIARIAFGATPATSIIGGISALAALLVVVRARRASRAFGEPYASPWSLMFVEATAIGIPFKTTWIGSHVGFRLDANVALIAGSVLIALIVWLAFSRRAAVDVAIAASAFASMLVLHAARPELIVQLLLPSVAAVAVVGVCELLRTVEAR
jgi:hypothetical protein